MKKTTNSKIFGLSLATILVLASSITVQAVTNPIKGDFNNDALLDSKDSAILKTNILLASKDTTYDVNSDTKINILDYIALSKMFVHTPLTDTTNITSAFTDVNFKNAIYALIGKNGPVPILYSDVKNLKNLNISSKGISSLNGIEYFTSLTSLYCSSNQLTSLDVSKNTALTTLACSSNKLTTLDISKNIVLNYVDTSSNQLSALDVTKNISLNYLNANSNQISALDVSKNIALTYLSCYSNKLTTLNTINNSNLIYLSCASNQLPTLDVSTNTALTYLDCQKNFLSDLDINKNISLNFFNCSYNNITKLLSIKDTWNDIFYKTQYTDLAHTTTTSDLIIINDTADITNKFTDTNFKNEIYSLIGKVSPNPILYSDVKGIKNLDLDSKNISNLSGIEYFTALTTLSCAYNKLTTLDVTKNTALTKLICYGKEDGSSNQLTTLDVSKNTALTYLNCPYNKLSTLDVSKNTALTDLFCYSNQLTNLDLTKNTALTSLYCSYNQLTTLDVSKNTSLVGLYCNNNQLTTLDVTKNTSLTSLYCPFNQISTLDVSNNLLLIVLYCTDNQLITLDISKNAALTDLYCYNNQISTLYSIKDNWDTNYYKSQYTDSTHTNTTDTLILSIPNNADITAKFTDTNFKNEIYSLIGKASSNPILYSDVKNITVLDVSSKNIISLDGIEYFTALNVLRCWSNKITSLDVSKNTALTELNCSGNNISNLDVSKNITLTKLLCSGIGLFNLDVSNNIALTELNCNDNQLSTLDITKNILLTDLYFNNNQITTLYSIDAYDSSYYTIQYTDSTHTNTTNNLIITIPDNADIVSRFTDENFKTALYSLIGKSSSDPILYSDVKNITNLELGSKDISSLNGIEYFISLTSLNCSNNNLTTFNLSNNTKLTGLDCTNNKLTTLNVTYNTELNDLSCSNNQLTNLDVHNNAKLNNLNCANNQLTYLYFTNNIALTKLTCTNNLLTILDLSTNTLLTTLYCDSNDLGTLNVSKNTALTTLYCQFNRLGTYLNVVHCAPATLDVSHNPELTTLYCNDNQLMILDVSKNPKLTTLYCYNNLLVNLFTIENIWNASNYTPQYEDLQNKIPINDLVIITDDTEITDEFVPFFKYLIYNLTGRANTILYGYVKNITELNLKAKGISSVKGIEYFTSLSTIYCDNINEEELYKNALLTNIYY